MNGPGRSRSGDLMASLADRYITLSLDGSGSATASLGPRSTKPDMTRDSATAS